MENRYSDLDMGLVKNPVSNDILKVVDVQAVKSSVRNLLLMERFDVPFHPEFSSGISDLLFDNLLPTSPAVIEKQIAFALKNFEPRVDLMGIEISLGSDKNAIRIDVYFKIKETNEPAVLNLILNRTR